jgi:hypothetical protein
MIFMVNRLPTGCSADIIAIAFNSANHFDGIHKNVNQGGCEAGASRLVEDQEASLAVEGYQ